MPRSGTIEPGHTTETTMTKPQTIRYLDVPLTELGVTLADLQARD